MKKFSKRPSLECRSGKACIDIALSEEPDKPLYFLSTDSSSHSSCYSEAATECLIESISSL